jgi:type IV pilus assembly protein PilB
MDEDEGRYLYEKGYASWEQIDEARKWQQTTRGELAEILMSLGVCPRDVYEAKAMRMQVPFVDLTVYRPDSSAIDAVPEHVAKRHNVLPIKRDGNTLYVAMADLNNLIANDAIRLVSGCTVRGVLAVPAEIAAAIDRLYS